MGRRQAAAEGLPGGAAAGGQRTRSVAGRVDWFGVESQRTLRNRIRNSLKWFVKFFWIRKKGYFKG